MSNSNETERVLTGKLSGAQRLALFDRVQAIIGTEAARHELNIAARYELEELIASWLRPKLHLPHDSNDPVVDGLYGICDWTYPATMIDAIEAAVILERIQPGILRKREGV